MIVYEIRLQTNTEDTNLLLPIKTECQGEEENETETNNVYKDVDNFGSYINLNTDATANGVLNILQDNIFDIDSKPIIENDMNIFESSVQFMENNKPTENDGQLENDLNLALVESSAENEDSSVKRVYNYMDIESKLREIHESAEELVTDLCRLCSKHLSVDDKTVIYGENENLDEKINSCLPIKVFKGDGLPNQICGECLTKLSGFSEFVQTVIQADKVLRLKFM